MHYLRVINNANYKKKKFDQNLDPALISSSQHQNLLTQRHKKVITTLMFFRSYVLITVDSLFYASI